MLNKAYLSLPKFVLLVVYLKKTIEYRRFYDFQKDTYTTTRFAFKFFLKITQIVRFWSILGKINPRHEKNRCILHPKFRTLGVWGHSGAQNMVFLSFLVLLKWPLRRRFELILCARNRFWSQIDPGPRKNCSRYNLTCFYHFWALFCMKPTRHTLSRPFLDQKFPNASKIAIFCPQFALKKGQCWSV